MKVKVCAKLNLTLNVIERQGQFHPLDSVAVSVDVFDVVEVTKRTDSQVVVHCNGVEPTHNTAYKVATQFVQQFGTTGCEISIQKGIPFASGMGGSSADASATVYCLCKLYNVDVENQQIANLCASVGSDVNMMLVGGLCRMTGRGEVVEQHFLSQQLHFALTTFNCPTSTASVFAHFDSLVEKPCFANNGKVLEILQSNTPWSCYSMFSNNLQQLVSSTNAQVSNYLQFCKQHGFHATMTGSGSAFFIACQTEAQAKEVSDVLCNGGFSTVACCSQNKGIFNI